MRADGLGGSPLPPVHQRHDREAEGHRPHDRRLPRRRRDDAPLHLRREARLGLLVRRRHRLGHRAQLHRLRAALQRDDLACSTRACPDFPERDRWWDIVERYKVDILYTAPTAIRAHMKWGPEHARGTDLSSLRLLGSVGEPINPEAWMWYRETIGAGKTPVVDTWWQTETGMIAITPLPGVTTVKPGSATKPFPGIDAAVVDEEGDEVPHGGRRLPRDPPSLAGDAPRDPRRPRPLRRDLLEPLSRRLLHGRRREARRRRRLLAHGPRGRRHERLRPPHLDDRGRERARRPSERRRGGGVRPQRTRRPARRSSPS